MELVSPAMAADGFALSVAPMAAESLEGIRLRRAELAESITALELALAAPAPGRVPAWAERVHVALIELSADLRAHVEVTEGPGGLHREVIEDAPRLAGRVQRLARDHGEISRMVADLMVCLSEPVPEDSLTAIRGLGTTLLGRLVRHRQAGADLVYEAYQADVGGEN